jgi:thiopeptide-type bacteriocin biosynthesis protein
MPDGLRALLTPVLGGQAETFVAGGLAAIAADRGQRWVQLGLTARRGHWPEVLGELDELSSELLDGPAVTNFFFMRKPPGLRVRFETTPPRRPELDEEVQAQLDRLRPHVEYVVPGVYEPEEQLFGGPASMPFVHRIFTIDSRAWLAFSRLGSQTPAWVFSLALLRHLLDGVGVAGWEDLDVWQRIVHQTGRQLPADLSGDKLDAACAGIRALWTDPDALAARLPEPVAALVGEWGPRLRAAGRDWSTGYFYTRGAVIGPREGMAFATIFHWNRGGISAAVQATIAAALADRAARP